MAKQRHIAKQLLLLVVGLLCLGIAPATAVPDGGAGPNTPGTSGSVSPRQPAAGDTIRFTVSGFPAGEVVYVKIDDGNFCSDKGVHGACVVHQQRLGASGSASGSFVLPGDLRPGRHWLRFLASEEILDDQGRYLGTKGYTTRAGTDFTVVEGGRGTAPDTPTTGTPDSTGDTPSTSTGGAGDPEVTVVAAGEILEVSVAKGTKGTKDAQRGRTDSEVGHDSAEGVADTSAQADSSDEALAAAEAAPAAAEARFPWVGVVGLAVFLVFGAGLLVRSRRA